MPATIEITPRPVGINHMEIDQQVVDVIINIEEVLAGRIIRAIRIQAHHIHVFVVACCPAASIGDKLSAAH